MHNSSTSSVHHGKLQSHLPRTKSRNHDGKLNLIFVWFSYKCFSFFMHALQEWTSITGHYLRGLTHHNWEISLCKYSTYSVSKCRVSSTSWGSGDSSRSSSGRSVIVLVLVVVVLIVLVLVVDVAVEVAVVVGLLS